MEPSEKKSPLKILKLIENYYIYDKLLFITSSGTVYQGAEVAKSSKSLNPKKVMIQVINKGRMEKEDPDSASNFVTHMNFLKEVCCDYWLELITFYETEHSFYIVCEATEELVSLSQMVKKFGSILKEDKEVFSLLLQLMKAYIPFCTRNLPHGNLNPNTIFPTVEPRTKTDVYKIAPFFHYNSLDLIHLRL